MKKISSESRSHEEFKTTATTMNKSMVKRKPKETKIDVAVGPENLKNKKLIEPSGEYFIDKKFIHYKIIV